VSDCVAFRLLLPGAVVTWFVTGSRTSAGIGSGKGSRTADKRKTHLTTVI
jgi:hypothetical protein